MVRSRRAGGKRQRQAHYSYDERAHQMLAHLWQLADAGDTVNGVCRHIGVQPATRFRKILNDMVDLQLLSKEKTQHWNGQLRYVYRACPKWIQARVPEAYDWLVKTYGLQLELEM